MRIVSYIIPGALVLASVFALQQGATAKKQAEIAKSQITIKEAEGVNADLYSPADLISARQVIEGLAIQHRLNVRTRIEGRAIIVSSAPQKVAPVAAEGQPVKPDSKAAGGDKEDRQVTLADPDAILGFLSGLTTLPYAVSYKTICIGIDCPNAIEMTISFGEPAAPASNGLNPAQPPAGQAISQPGNAATPVPGTPQTAPGTPQTAPVAPTPPAPGPGQPPVAK